MKVIINNLDKVNLEDFANEYNLTMLVSERDMAAQVLGMSKYTAKFKGVEVKKGLTLEGAYGNANTPEDAIKDYCKQISGKWIVANAYGKDRMMVYAPHLMPEFTMEVQNT